MTNLRRASVLLSGIISASLFDPNPRRAVSTAGSGVHDPITDYAWNSVEPGGIILGRMGATLLLPSTGAEDELMRLAIDVDGILTCWKPVTEAVIRNASQCKVIGRYGIDLDKSMLLRPQSSESSSPMSLLIVSRRLLITL